MKRRNASLLGNVLMGLGLMVMVVGVGYSILNQLPQLDLPQYFASRFATNTGGCATTTSAAVAISISTANVLTNEHRNGSFWSRFFCITY